MVTINLTYEGGLHCKAVHEPSGTVLVTDAPRDNMGKGESFSPTDLVATALGSCILTVMGIAACKLEISIDGAKATVHKEMIAKPERRIGSLSVHVHMPPGISDEHKKKLAEAAHACPVHKSLNHEIHAPIEFIWD